MRGRQPFGLQAAQRADVCLLVIDGQAGLTQQDVNLAKTLDAYGRAVVVVLNKWDVALQTENFNHNDVRPNRQEHAQLTVPTPVVVFNRILNEQAIPSFSVLIWDVHALATTIAAVPRYLR